MIKVIMVIGVLIVPRVVIGANSCSINEDRTCRNPGAACVEYHIFTEDTAGVCNSVASGCNCT